MVNVIARDRDIAQSGAAATARTDEPGHGSGDEEGDENGQEHPHHGVKRGPGIHRYLHPGSERGRGARNVGPHRILLLPQPADLWKSTQRSARAVKPWRAGLPGELSGVARRYVSSAACGAGGLAVSHASPIAAC